MKKLKELQIIYKTLHQSNLTENDFDYLCSFNNIINDYPILFFHNFTRFTYSTEINDFYYNFFNTIFYFLKKYNNNKKAEYILNNSLNETITSLGDNIKYLYDKKTNYESFSLLLINLLNLPENNFLLISLLKYCDHTNIFNFICDNKEKINNYQLKINNLFKNNIFNIININYDKKYSLTFHKNLLKKINNSFFNLNNTQLTNYEQKYDEILNYNLIDIFNISSYKENILICKYIINKIPKKQSLFQIIGLFDFLDYHKCIFTIKDNLLYENIIQKTLKLENFFHGNITNSIKDVSDIFTLLISLDLNYSSKVLINRIKKDKNNFNNSYPLFDFNDLKNIDFNKLKEETKNNLFLYIIYFSRTLPNLDLKFFELIKNNLDNQKILVETILFQYNKKTCPEIKKLVQKYKNNDMKDFKELLHKKLKNIK